MLGILLEASHAPANNKGSEKIKCSILIKFKIFFIKVLLEVVELFTSFFLAVCNPSSVYISASATVSETGVIFSLISSFAL